MPERRNTRRLPVIAASRERAPRSLGCAPHTLQPKDNVTIVSTPQRTEDLRNALRHHMDGRYDEAERIYLHLHEQNKEDEEVLYLIGVLCCDLGIFTQACRFLEQALSLVPGFPEAARQLLIAAKSAGIAHIATGDLAQADQAFKRALELAPSDRDAWRGRAQIALMRDKPEPAQVFLERALQQDGNDVDSLNWHGLACLQQKNYAMARNSLEHAIALKPDLVQAHNNLGLCFLGMSQLAKAEQSFHNALQLAPNDAGARINLANTMRIQGRALEAREQLEQVLQAEPDSVEALNNLGAALQDLGLPVEARASLTRALTLAPASPQARWNLALSQLALADYANGWANFEARWEGCANLQGAYSKPRERAWHGADLHGKTLLLWAEQGFGDTLQFIRFARPLAERGATVIVEVQEELARLCASAPGVAQVVVRGQSLPDYDFNCPLMSLPGLLGSQSFLDTPYLFADAARIEDWRTRLAAYAGRKVGLVWAGKSRLENAELQAIDKRRSVTLKQLAPLLDVPGNSFFSLQKGTPAGELPEAGLSIHDYSAQWQDFGDTAAFIANLDLVISVDTAVAHLAGALGKPVWLLNRFDSCWRWGIDRVDTPWYPLLRQFRQPRHGDWESPIAAIRQALMAMETDLPRH